MRDVGGFTLIELTVIIVVLGIIAAVVFPRLGGLSEAARETATREEMRRLKAAIVGVPGNDGRPRGGFEVDVGFAPSRLEDLVVRPDSISAWDTKSQEGWNGPYIDGAEDAYLTDGWDSTYRYDPTARTLSSTGGAASIVLAF